jgi:predicted permease
MSALWADVRQAARGLVRTPGFATAVALTLALGIGAATAVFNLIDGVILRPLPYPDAERLVLITQQNPGGRWNTSVVDFQAMQEAQQSFEAIAAVQTIDMAMTSGREPQWLRAGRATADYFRVMGLSPARGRTFQAGEDAPGAAPVVVLGHAFAERQFGSGADALGQPLMLDGQAYSVIGVMPPGVEQLPGMRADVWPVLQMQPPERRGPFLLRTVARLREDVGLEQAADELASISRNIFPLWHQGFPDETARLSPMSLHEAVVGNSGNVLWVAFGAVLVVLLIALVNVVNLLLMRVTERSSQLTIRAALGASRVRLMRLLMSESLLLAVLGGIAGVGLAALLLELYRSLGPSLPRLAQVTLDFRVIAFGGGLALLSGLFIGAAPLLFDGLGTPLAARQQARGATAGRGQHRFRNLLVMLEFAMALPLLVAAGLLINSLVQLQRVDPGFAADHLLTLRASLIEANHPDAEARLAFWVRALPELRALPGVTGAALATGVPPDSPWTYNNFDLVGRSVGAGAQPVSPWTAVDAALFEVLGVPLLEGRVFDERDWADDASPPVVMVSETWAMRYFPGESAVGRQLHEGGDTANPVTIIGVVGDVKWNGLEESGEAVYAALGQGWPNNPVYLLLRTGPDPLALVEPVRAALQRLDPTLVPTEVLTMENRLRESLGTQRHWTAVITAFALSAVLLSAIGVFGVLAFYVSRQRREIGIRVALGANARRIELMVVRRGLAYALAGTLIGIILAVFLTRGLESLLYDVARTDPPTLISACAVLLVIALVASWLPARRATRVHPMEALREE